METVDASHMRAMNCSILLKLIWKRRHISRADISRLTGMSRSTVSAIVTELMQKGLVQEIGIGASNGGRRPVMLSFQEAAYSILGLEIGPDFVAVALVDLKGGLRRWLKQTFPVAEDPAAGLAVVTGLIRELQAEAMRENTPLIGIGWAMPLFANKLEAEPQKQMLGWSDILRAELKIPVFVEAEAQLGALAELWWNVESGTGHLAFVQLSSALSAGLLIHGHLHRDDPSIAGAFGDILMLLKNDGSQRSLDDLLGGAALVRKTKVALDTGEVSSMAKQSLTPTAIFEAAAAGDELARCILDRASGPLALALSNLQILLQLDRIVVGGLWRQEIPLLLDKLRQLNKQRGRDAKTPESWLTASHKGDQQLALGAATLVLEKALDDLLMFPIQPKRPTGAAALRDVRQ